MQRWYRTRHGPGVSPDSAAYVGTARNLAAGRGLLSFDDSVLTMFPAGFPTILAAWHVFGLDAATVARWLGAAAFSTEVALAFLLLRRHVSSVGLAVASTAAVALSPMALRVSGMIWSEPLFVVVVLGLLVALEDWMRSERLGVLAAAVVLSWCGFLLRYTGIALAGVTLTVAALVWLREKGLLRAIGRVALLVGGLSVVPVGWALRNIAEGSGAFGDRTPSNRGLLTNIRDTIETFSSWVLPSGVPVVARLVLLAVVVLGAGAIVWSRQPTGTERAAVPSSGSSADVRASLVPIIAYIAVYLVVEVGSASITTVNRLDERLLYPLFVPLVVLLASAADTVISNPRLIRRVRNTIVLGFAAWLVLQTGLFLKAVHQRERDGIGFAAVSWQASRLVRDVQRLPGDAQLFSNLPEPVSYITRRTVRFGPPRNLAENVDLRSEPAQLLRDAKCGMSTYLAWFPNNSNPRGFVMPPRLLARRVALEPQSRERDGILYRVRSLPMPSSTQPRGNRCST